MDRLTEIFNQQASHMKEYAQIEKTNGLLQTDEVPVDLTDRMGQARLKDFAWRISEELGEALEFAETDEDEYKEEISDTLHFLAEFTILAGGTPQSIIRNLQPKEDADIETTMADGYVESISLASLHGTDYLGRLFSTAHRRIEANTDLGLAAYSSKEHLLTWATGHVLKNLALTCNQLKNKAWSTRERPVNVDNFIHYLQETWVAFAQLSLLAKIGSEELHSLYFKKSAINEKRRETGY